MKPTIGRIVIYRSLGDAAGRFPPEDHPAIITGLTDGVAHLHIFYKTGTFDMVAVEGVTPGTWRWPERV